MRNLAISLLFSALLWVALVFAFERAIRWVGDVNRPRGTDSVNTGGLEW